MPRAHARKIFFEFPHPEILISGDGRTLVVVPDNSFRINDTLAVAITALRTGRGIWGYQKSPPTRQLSFFAHPCIGGT